VKKPSVMLIVLGLLSPSAFGQLKTQQNSGDPAIDMLGLQSVSDPRLSQYSNPRPDFLTLNETTPCPSSDPAPFILDHDFGQQSILLCSQAKPQQWEANNNLANAATPARRTDSDSSPSAPSSAPASAATTNTINSAAADLAPPESPAFAVLGLTPQTVTRPNTPAELASSLLNGFDHNGNFQTGIAIDTGPYMLFKGNSLTLYDYHQSPLKRFLARSQVSFATTKGTSDPDKAMRLALGTRFTIFDRGDPRNDPQLIDCFDKNLKFDGPIPPNASADDLQAALEVKAQKCRSQASLRNWNASSWIVAAAPAWISPDGNTGSFHLNGGGVWTSIAYGFEGVPSLRQRAQLIAEAVIRNNESVPDPKNSGAFLNQNSRSIGGRFRFGSPAFNGNIEGAYVTTKQPAQLSDNSYKISAGIEHRLTSKLWLNLTFARDSSTPTTNSHFSFLSGLTWNFSQQAKYSPIPSQ
jgi:hypothetical protein